MYPRTEDGWRWCRASVRCALCNSALVEGDRVVIVREDGHHSNPFTFVFSFDEMYRDEKDQIICNFRIIERWHARTLEETCHVHCLTMKHAQLSKGFVKAMRYSYHPSPQELTRRNLWLWAQLAQILHGALGRFSVPLEICEMIARNCCMSGFIISTANAFWLETEKETRENYLLDLSADVWARYVEFQGTRYIASLESSPRGQHTSKLYSADPVRKIKAVYVAEDYLGIRDVRFAGSSNEEIACIERQPGVWWTTMEVKDTTELMVYNDGTKLRSVRYRGDRFSRSRMFEVPKPLNKQLRWVPIFFSNNELRMSSLILNDPKSIGYSVCCGTRPYTILPDTSGKQNSFYFNVGLVAAREAVWLYMPMDKDEIITELWVRNRNGNSVEPDTLIFCTSNGRTHIMGPYGRNHNSHPYSYKLRYLPKPGPDRIYYDKSLRGIYEFAFEDLAPPPSTYPKPNLPQPERLLLRPHFDNSPCFYTFASLDDVVEVTPCMLDVQNVGPAIVGLLFRYRDGRRASVGQIRLDMLQTPLEVPMDTSQDLCLRFHLSGSSYANATEVYLQNGRRDEESSPADGQQMNIPWSGKLEWWFSHGACWLSHGDQKSPMAHFRPRLLADEI